MAIGDKAAAKGLQVFAGTQDRRKGYENDNQRGDELADEIDARTAADTTEKNARIAADALKVDKDLFKVQKADPGHLEGRVWVSWV